LNFPFEPRNVYEEEKRSILDCDGSKVSRRTTSLFKKSIIMGFKPPSELTEHLKPLSGDKDQESLF
jgi:hypothetical protein